MHFRFAKLLRADQINTAYSIRFAIEYAVLYQICSFEFRIDRFEFGRMGLCPIPNMQISVLRKSILMLSRWLGCAHTPFHTVWPKVNTFRTAQTRNYTRAVWYVRPLAEVSVVLSSFCASAGATPVPYAQYYSIRFRASNTLHPHMQHESFASAKPYANKLCNKFFFSFFILKKFFYFASISFSKEQKIFIIWCMGHGSSSFAKRTSPRIDLLLYWNVRNRVRAM